mgnify:CR=1 FL=1
MLDHGPVEDCLRALQKEAYAIAKSKGWHKEPNPVPQSLCLMHSEISEALEVYREGDFLSRVDSMKDAQGELKPVGFGVEMADVLIRVLDTCEEHGIDLGPILLAKMDYNRRRQVGHGGKVC